MLKFNKNINFINGKNIILKNFNQIQNDKHKIYLFNNCTFQSTHTIKNLSNKIPHNNYKIPEHLNNYCSFECDEKQCSNNKDCKKKLKDNNKYGWGLCDGKFGYGLKLGIIPYVNSINFFNIKHHNLYENFISNTKLTNLNIVDESSNQISDSINNSDFSFFEIFSEN